MDHNVGLTDEQDISEYVKRDVAKRSTTLPYKIVRDEIVGRWDRFEHFLCALLQYKKIPMGCKYSYLSPANGFTCSYHIFVKTKFAGHF